MSDGDYAGFAVVGGIEDLAGHVTSCGDHNEPGLMSVPAQKVLYRYLDSRGSCSLKADSLVEDRDATQLAAVPFCHVLVEIGVDTFDKGTNERYLHRGAGN